MLHAEDFCCRHKAVTEQKFVPSPYLLLLNSLLSFPMDASHRAVPFGDVRRQSRCVLAEMDCFYCCPSPTALVFRKPWLKVWFQVFVTLNVAFAMRLGEVRCGTFFIIIVSVSLFYCAHWSTYCTGQLRYVIALLLIIIDFSPCF